MSRGSLPPVEDDFARALLGSAEADAPSHAAYVKAAATLGIGVGLGAALPLAPTAVAVGAASMAGVARWSSSLGAKLVLIGASAALVVGAGALLLRSSGSAEPAPQVRSAPAAATAQAAHAGLQPSLPATVTPPRNHEPSAARLIPALPRPTVAGAAAARSAEQPLAAAAVRAPAAAPPAAGAPAARRVARALPAEDSSGSTLAEQVQSLDRARVALASGNSSSALAEISRYRAAWPDGVFLTEASVLEIEALAARGERSQAATRAADFVAAHPDSPQANRLRTLIPSPKH